MVALVLSAVLALTSHSNAAQARTAGFPIKGTVVAGKSIGGISLGLTKAQVLARWGRNYTVSPYLNCKTKSKACAIATWLYEYRGGEPLGAAVSFSKAGKVVAVFTLGSPAGWGMKGLMMGDPVSNVYNLFGNTGSAQCIGYNALTVRIGAATMSFYSASGVIYGYALTGPTEAVCQ